jgi:hypothetical protein
MNGSVRLIVGVALLLSLPVQGCDRLNPAWCEEHARCSPGERCDPTTNTCRPMEAGSGADHGVDLGPDSVPWDHGSGLDTSPGADLALPDLSPVPDAPPGPG